MWRGVWRGGVLGWLRLGGWRGFEQGRHFTLAFRWLPGFWLPGFLGAVRSFGLTGRYGRGGRVLQAGATEGCTVAGNHITVGGTG